MPDASIMNEVCPVCGSAIPADMPPLALHPQARKHLQDEDDDGRTEGFRVCSEGCAHIASQDPLRYREAAGHDAVAGPPAHDRGA